MTSQQNPAPVDRRLAVNAALNALASQSADFSLAVARFQTCLDRSVIGQKTGQDAGLQGHCKLVICEPCQRVRFLEERTELLSRVRAVYDRSLHTSIMSVTLSSPVVTLHEIGNHVDRMILAWSRLVERKSFQSVTAGFARVVRLEVDMEKNAAICHTSILMIAERSHAFHSEEAWKAAWFSIGRSCQEDRVSYFHAIAHEDPAATARLEAEVDRIAYIGVDPLELCEFVDTTPTCDPVKLGHVLHALKGRKLIRTGRNFKRKAF
ncbi:MAG: protein rep [Hyphomicrobiaceae bacterium]|nr:protein rep [Hyphomicrobiaceae bacterium]